MREQVAGVTFLQRDHAAVVFIHPLVEAERNPADTGREAVGGGELPGHMEVDIEVNPVFLELGEQVVECLELRRVEMLKVGKRGVDQRAA